MQLQYAKMEGAGNRIVVVDQRAGGRPPPPPETLRRLADSRTGPGFDQLMWVGAARQAGSDASYRVFNADGSEVEQCGNGVRCVARVLGGDRQRVVLDGPAGIVEARLLPGGDVAVDMGAPVFDPQRIPFTADAEADRYPLDVGGHALQVAVLSMGNPHCVLDVDDVETADVDGLGPLIEMHPRFPRRCNVGFRRIRGRDRIDLRVFERGVGETRACGTGACAAVVSAQRCGQLDTDVRVRLPGGQLVVSWHGAATPVWLTGNAALIEQGAIDV